MLTSQKYVSVYNLNKKKNNCPIRLEVFYYFFETICHDKMSKAPVKTEINNTISC